jgi:hypothetical protein
LFQVNHDTPVGQYKVVVIEPGEAKCNDLLGAVWQYLPKSAIVDAAGPTPKLNACRGDSATARLAASASWPIVARAASSHFPVLRYTMARHELKVVLGGWD